MTTHANHLNRRRLRPLGIKRFHTGLPSPPSLPNISVLSVALHFVLLYSADCLSPLQIPDVYDSAKYDAIHNAHLQLEGLAELLPLSKLLADGVVPNEYGTHPHSKLRIGATIAAELLKKLLIDLSNTRDETFHASRVGGEGFEAGSGGGGAGGGGGIDTCNISSWQRGVMAERAARAAAEAAASADASASAATPRPASDTALAAGGDAALEAAAGASEGDPDAADETREDLEDSEEDEQSTRLHPGAADVNSPHRHVRTRVYLTSESHIHSLISVLRYAHLEPPPVAPPPSRPGSSLTLAEAEAESLGDIYAGKWWRSGSGPVFCAGAATASAPATPAGPGAASAPAAAPKPLLSHEADDTLAATPEFDYLSQIVFRMYERFDYPVTHPQRFRLELSFSRGAAVDWARAPPPSASGGGGGGGSGSAVTLPLPEAAYAGSLFMRTPLQCDAGGSRGAASAIPPTPAEGVAAAEGGDQGFLTLARAEATLWRFGRQPAQRHLSSGLPPLPPSAAPHAPPAPTPPPAEDAAAASTHNAVPRPAAAVALLGRLSGAQ